MSKKLTTDYINFNYFNGLYKDVWREAFPIAITELELKYLISEGDLTPNANILDLMCGYGRLSINLARKGFKVTAVDNLSDYINEMNETTVNEKLSLDCVQSNVLDFKANNFFDLVICMGNSQCLLNKVQSKKVFKNIFSSLKDGGKFIFGTWSIAEIVLNDFKNQYWYYCRDMKCLHKNTYEFNPSRIEAETIIIPNNGKTEKKQFVQYIYTIAEIENMLNEVGLTLIEIHGSTFKNKFYLGSPSAYFIAQKKV